MDWVARISVPTCEAMIPHTMKLLFRRKGAPGCADVVRLPQQWPVQPACHGEKDQMFLVLAHVGQADAFLTGGCDLLVMRDEFPGLMIVTPNKWARQRGEPTWPLMRTSF